MEKERINLDNFLKEFTSYKHLHGFTIKNNINNLERTLIGYQKAIELSRNLIYTKTKEQNYTRVFPIDGDNYYTISWDIYKAKMHIKNNNMPKYKMEIDGLWKNVSTQYIDYAYINNELGFDKYDPIIVVFFSPLNEYIVIDGNHRLAKQRMKNPKGKVDVYILEPDDHLSVMCGELFRTCYKIAHNTTVISNFALGNIDNYFYSNSYKPETGAKFLYRINLIKLWFRKFLSLS